MGCKETSERFAVCWVHGEWSIKNTAAFSTVHSALHVTQYQHIIPICLSQGITIMLKNLNARLHPDTRPGVRGGRRRRLAVPQ